MDFIGDATAENLWLRIGMHSAGHAVEIREGPERKQEDEPDHKSKIAVFNVPAGAIKDGTNKLIIRSESVSTTILGIDVVIHMATVPEAEGSD